MRVRTGSLDVLRPAGMDSWTERVSRWAGHVVRVIQPRGVPKNGTFRHCYVETAEDHQFIGLVLVNSLQRRGNRNGR